MTLQCEPRRNTFDSYFELEFSVKSFNVGVDNVPSPVHVLPLVIVRVARDAVASALLV
jgi:hypothetical protein